MRSLLLALVVAACGGGGGADVPFVIEIVNNGPRAAYELGGDVDGEPIRGTQLLSTGEHATLTRTAHPGATVGMSITFSGVVSVAEAQPVSATGLRVTAIRAAGGEVSFAYSDQP